MIAERDAKKIALSSSLSATEQRTRKANWGRITLAATTILVTIGLLYVGYLFIY